MNEYIESEKDSSNKTFRLTLTILIGIIVLSPILIAIFVTNDWAFTKMLPKVDGNSSIWIGFLGELSWWRTRDNWCYFRSSVTK